MASDPDLSPTSTLRSRPYGDGDPAAAGPGLLQHATGPGVDSIHIGIVTDVSTRSHSCTVTIPKRTKGHGFPCLWGAASINRWGGSADFNPPEIGSLVVVYEFRNMNMGVVLCQVPSMGTSPDPELARYLDPDSPIDAFDDSTGQSMEALSMGGSALGGHRRMPLDCFPGDRGFWNESGVAVAALRFRALLRGSETCKIEMFPLGDLTRIVGHALDVWTGAGELTVRETVNGLLVVDHGETGSSAESRGGEGRFGRWRRLVLGAAAGDVLRDYVALPSGNPEETPDIGLAQTLRDSTGLHLERSIVGGGFVKTRAIGVPRKLHNLDDPELSESPPPEVNPEDLADFGWPDGIDPSASVRDALAWVTGRQSGARLSAIADATGAWEVPGDDPETSGAPGQEARGGDAAAGGHFRDMEVPLDVIDLDPSPENGKGRLFRVGDAWILVLPDGTVTIRDIWASTLTMHGGHITCSPSKDLNLVAGRSINLKAGRDINVNARRGLDLTAGEQQVRVWGKKSVLVHSETGGVMLSTANPGNRSGGADKTGEDFNPPGIVLKTPGSVALHSKGEYHYASDQFFFGGTRTEGTHHPDSWPMFVTEADYHLMKSRNDFLWRSGDEQEGHNMRMFGQGDVSLKATGSMEIEKDIMMFDGRLHTTMTAEDLGSPVPPGYGWTSLRDTDAPLFTNEEANGSESMSRRNSARGKAGEPPDGRPVPTGTPYGWGNYRGDWFTHEQLRRMEFSHRTEKQFGTSSDDFRWYETHWQREWSGTVPWGAEEVSVGPESGNRTAVYPGISYWDGDKGFARYREVNVDRKGAAVPRDYLSREPREVEISGFASMPRHPGD